MDQVHFLARMEMLDSMMQWIRKWADQTGFDTAVIRKIELAMEEALVNVIRYAYRQGEGEIELLCRIDPYEQIEFIIQDQGRPFNPLLQSQIVDPSIALEERKEGGLGILLFLQYMDEVHYERQEPYNILKLIKRKTILTEN